MFRRLKMSTLTVGIIALVAVGFVFWYLNRKTENFTKVEAEENKSAAETAPYKVPEPAATPITLVVETPAPVVEAVAEAIVEAAPVMVAPKSTRTRKSTATVSKPKVPAKKVATEKPTQVAPARKKAKLKTAK